MAEYFSPQTLQRLSGDWFSPETRKVLDVGFDPSAIKVENRRGMQAANADNPVEEATNAFLQANDQGSLWDFAGSIPAWITGAAGDVQSAGIALGNVLPNAGGPGMNSMARFSDQTDPRQVRVGNTTLTASERDPRYAPSEPTFPTTRDMQQKFGVDPDTVNALLGEFVDAPRTGLAMGTTIIKGGGKKGGKKATTSGVDNVTDLSQRRKEIKQEHDRVINEIRMRVTEDLQDMKTASQLESVDPESIHKIGDRFVSEGPATVRGNKMPGQVRLEIKKYNRVSDDGTVYYDVEQTFPDGSKGMVTLKNDNLVSAQKMGGIVEAKPTNAMVDEVASEHEMRIQRADRKTGSVRALSPGEAKLVRASVPKARQKVVSADVRRTKERYPVDDGWEPFEVRRVVEKEAKDGSISYDVEYRPVAYGFARGADGKPLKKEQRQQRVDELSQAVVEEVNTVKQRAAAGDPNAQVILRQAEWYKGMRRELREKYGGMGDLFADLLGALSPQTDVATNYRYAAEALERFTKGEFRDDVAKFVKYLDDGGKIGKYTGPVPVQLDSGNKFGINSKNMMLAMADLWRVISPGTAPKARNFSGNLIGLTNEATIDVWAARNLNRLSGNRRVPPPAEGAVQGKWNASATGITGDFAFGQDVYRQAADELGVNPDDLQAMMWFREKEVWTENNWTSKTGEGGSFELEAAKRPSERSVVGLSTDRPGAPATPENMTPIQNRMWTNLSNDSEVKAIKVEQSVGMYMDDVEPAFDVEIVTTPNHDPARLFDEVATTAKESNQESAFVSRVITDPTASDNIRPGMEVYFAQSTDIQGAQDVIKAIRELGVDGFTVIKDPRGSVVGVRYQYVPEFDIMYGQGSIDNIEDLVRNQEDVLDDLIDRVAEMENISHAEVMSYDTVVLTGNNYDNFTGAGRNALAAEAGKGWPRRTLRESVAEATGQSKEAAGRSADVPGRNALLGEAQ